MHVLPCLQDYQAFIRDLKKTYPKIYVSGGAG